MTDQYRTQHQKRLSYMPWLYATLKPRHRVWAEAWQQEVQDYLRAMETIAIGRDCFIAPEANLFAEPGRAITLGNHCLIAADTMLHGPIVLGDHVSINHSVTMDGGSAGIQIGNHSRIAAHCKFYAFNHGMQPDRLIHQQPVTSAGIRIGCDVWIGAGVGIVDGVTIGDHAVIGMGSVVTREIPAWAIAAGNPARVVGDRRSKGRGPAPQPRY